MGAGNQKPHTIPFTTDKNDSSRRRWTTKSKLCQLNVTFQQLLIATCSRFATTQKLSFHRNDCKMQSFHLHFNFVCLFQQILLYIMLVLSSEELSDVTSTCTGSVKGTRLYMRQLLMDMLTGHRMQ